MIDDGKLLPSRPSVAHFGNIVANTLFGLLATLRHGGVGDGYKTAASRYS